MTKPQSNSFLLLGALVGIALGFSLRFLSPSWSGFAGSLFILEICGDIFINLLKMVLIPLIFFSIVLGIAQLRNNASMKKIWPVTLIYYVCSLIAAITVGLTLANIFQPGQGLTIDMFKDHMQHFTAVQPSTGDIVKSFIHGLFINPIDAAANNHIFPIVVFAFMVGITFVIHKDRYHGTLTIFDECMHLIMTILNGIMIIAPIGVMALVAKLIATQDLQLFNVLSKYILVVTGATLLHGIIILPLALWLITGITPWKFFIGMKDALITALSTSSSTATMPVTLRCLNDNLKVPTSVSGFVIPLGTTVNMDGTALYEAMAALFVANLCGIKLTLMHQLIVAFTAMLASIGAPGIPSAGMVTMVMVLQSVGLPVEALAILIPIDRPLDTIRTMVNVEGDAVGACVVQKITQA